MSSLSSSSASNVNSVSSPLTTYYLTIHLPGNRVMTHHFRTELISGMVSDQVVSSDMPEKKMGEKIRTAVLYKRAKDNEIVSVTWKVFKSGTFITQTNSLSEHEVLELVLLLIKQLKEEFKFEFDYQLTQELSNTVSKFPDNLLYIDLSKKLPFCRSSYLVGSYSENDNPIENEFTTELSLELLKVLNKFPSHCGCYFTFGEKLTLLFNDNSILDKVQNEVEKVVTDVEERKRITYQFRKPLGKQVL